MKSLEGEIKVINLLKTEFDNCYRITCSFPIKFIKSTQITLLFLIIHYTML